MSSELPKCLSVSHLLETVGEDAKFFGELLELFKQEFVKNHALLLDSCEKRDIKNAELYAHSIKSSAANVGAVEVQARGKLLQEAAAAGRFEEILQLLPSVVEAYEEASRELLKWIESL